MLSNMLEPAHTVVGDAELHQCIAVVARVRTHFSASHSQGNGITSVTCFTE